MSNDPLMRRGRCQARHMSPHPSLLRCMALAALLSCLVACSTGAQVSQALSPTRRALAELDEFGALLINAGLPVGALPVGPELSVVEARRLLLTLQWLQPTYLTYAPRYVAQLLLQEVEKAGRSMARAELGRRLQEFQSLLLLRPDGFLAAALTGEPEQCVGPVEVQGGALRAGELEVGHFYRRDAEGELRPVDVPR